MPALCPLCEAELRPGATQCSICGATVLPSAESIPKEGLAAPPASAPSPTVPESSLEVSAPVPPSTEMHGVVARPARVKRLAPPGGMTNGLRTPPRRGPSGVTSAMGRTNGLTNGVGRTNGLTNGLRGRTNGLTNGLGRTNGLTNGMGRTNGLTNGLVSLRRGLTNGLTNGNGFTNGLGSRRLQREARLNRWKLYIIPVLVVSLLTVPLLMPADYAVGLYPIRIDGDFSDWPAAALVAQSTSAAVDANVDIQRFGTFDNRDRLAFYAEVRGSALTGGGAPPRYDSLCIFLDTDQNAATGYVVAGMGADRLLEVSGWGGRVNRTTFSEWDTNRASRDWNGWIKSASIPAATLGSRLELDVSWASLLPQKGPIGVYAHFRSYRGDLDETDFVLNPFGPSLLVRVLPSPPEVLIGTDVTFLGLDLIASGGDVTYSEITVTAIGTAVPSTIGALRLVDSTNGLIQERIPTGRDITFQFSPRSISSGQSESLFVRGDVLGATGETLGLSIDSTADISAAPALVTIAHQPSVRTVGYLGAVPAGRRIDGGFSDWTNVSGDPLDLGRRPGVDLREYSFERSGSTIEVYIRVEGRAFEGVLVPEETSAAAGGAPSPGLGDSDRDTVPDVDDPMDFDFNNDGIDDVASGSDYDGDGITDYPLGPDFYLNTTIPSNFPPPYANRPVSLYIGRSVRPPLFGEEVARVFFDADNNTATGFRINVLGADYLLEFRGRAGVVTYRTLSSFAGASQVDWSWTAPLTPSAATDYARIEASFPISGLGFANNSLAYFEVMDWSLDKDASLDPILRIGAQARLVPGPAYAPTAVHTLDLAGNEKWFFTSANSAETVCTSNKDASTTAGASATSTALSVGQSICWYSPDGVPDTIAGTWEVILDIDKTADGAQVLSPNGNGATNGWIVDGVGCTDEANEWQCVDETPNDGDTTYIKSTSSTVTDSLFNVADWSAPSPLSVVNVAVEASCRRIAASSVAVAIIIRSGATTSVGASGNQNCANSATYTVWSDTWTTDPADGGAWTAAGINALQVGVRDADAQTQEARASHLKVNVTFVPVYSVQINECNNAACTSTTNLYPATNFNSYGSDVTIQTGTIAALTLTGQEHIQWKITLVNGGTVTIRYNGANPGTDDSRATVPVPEFHEVVVPLTGTLLIAAMARRWQSCRQRRRGNRSLGL